MQDIGPEHAIVHHNITITLLETSQPAPQFSLTKSVAKNTLLLCAGLLCSGLSWSDHLLACFGWAALSMMACFAFPVV